MRLIDAWASLRAAWMKLNRASGSIRSGSDLLLDVGLHDLLLANPAQST
jgi:hypothetical protein